MVLVCLFTEDDFWPLDNVLRRYVRVTLDGLWGWVKQLALARCKVKIKISDKAYREQCHETPR